MTNENDLDSKLQKAFRKGLSLFVDADCTSMEFAKSSEWDSIAHLQLIAAIEEEFNMMIETQEMLAMNSYLKAKEIVRKHDSLLP